MGPLDLHWVKLNIDGAVKGNFGLLDSYEGIIHGSDGEWPRRFVKNLDWCSSTKAELEGVYEGLKHEDIIFDTVFCNVIL